MLIQINKVSFQYQPGEDALRDVSFTLDAGERVALIGHNGSGKSTLARLLNGLLRPTSGEVLINGQPTNNRKVAELAHTVALLFQNPDDQICKRTVAEEVAFGPKNLGYTPERVQELVTAALESVELADVTERNPHDLGFSERKRLALASVLAMDTEVLVLDEPTAGLDSREIAMLERTLHSLSERGKAVILISHDMDFLAENVVRAICLEHGHLRFDGNVTDLFQHSEILKSASLLPPQIAQLCSCFQLRPARLTPEEFLNSFSASITPINQNKI